MGGIQRMMRSGIRLYNRIPMNMVGAPAGSHRPFYLRCGSHEFHWDVKSVKNTFNIDTSALTGHLKSRGIAPHKAEEITKSMAEYLVETVTQAGGDSSIELKEKFKSLEKSMEFYKIKEHPEVKKWRYISEGGFSIAAIACLTYYFTSEKKEIKNP